MLGDLINGYLNRLSLRFSWFLVVACDLNWQHTGAFLVCEWNCKYNQVNPFCFGRFCWIHSMFKIAKSKTVAITYICIGFVCLSKLHLLLLLLEFWTNREKEKKKNRLRKLRMWNINFLLVWLQWNGELCLLFWDTSHWSHVACAYLGMCPKVQRGPHEDFSLLREKTLWAQMTRTRGWLLWQTAKARNKPFKNWCSVHTYLTLHPWGFVYQMFWNIPTERVVLAQSHRSTNPWWMVLFLYPLWK